MPEDSGLLLGGACLRFVSQMLWKFPNVQLEAVSFGGLLGIIQGNRLKILKSPISGRDYPEPAGRVPAYTEPIHPVAVVLTAKTKKGSPVSG
jgi:hypothetical protein